MKGVGARAIKGNEPVCGCLPERVVRLEGLVDLAKLVVLGDVEAKQALRKNEKQGRNNGPRNMRAGGNV